MNNLLKNINDHKEKNNIPVCYHLYDFINQNNIQSEEELKKIESSYFNTDDLKIRNDIAYKSYISDITHHEKYDEEEKVKLIKYEDLYRKETDELLKTKYLILVYEVIDWKLLFPYVAYQLIIKDLMN